MKIMEGKISPFGIHLGLELDGNSHFINEGYL
jgi:hypothetical protein